MNREKLITLIKALHLDKLLFAIQNGTFDPLYKWSDPKLIRANMRHYKHRMGYSFDIKNPKTFTEKIQWYKFFYENPLIPFIVDKVTFKQYIEDKLGPGYTIPVYASWRDVHELENQWFAIGGCLKSFA